MGNAEPLGPPGTLSPPETLGDGPHPRHGTLVVRLSLVLVGIAALLAIWLLAVVAPALDTTLTRYGEETLQETKQTMRRVSEEQTRQSSQVLIDLIGHTTAARARALQDLPLESLGDVRAIRSAVVREDHQRSERQRSNVRMLAAEMQRRANRDLDERMQRHTEARLRREHEFVRGLNRTHLVLVAATLATLLLVLGFGLHRFVVRPAARLRAATRRVAAGELAADLPPPGPGELGDLTRDFAAMVAQLRTQRDELQHLADNLESEVQAKTRDLQATVRQLAQAERLAALGTLAGGVAHEFRNVIGGIRGCADELLAGDADADQRETLGVITRATERAQGIVQQLQRFAQEPDREPATLDVVDVLDEALRLCEPAARRHDVQVERRFADDLVVTGDAGSLHQVFVNLFVNAVQAMADGGVLRCIAARDGDAVVVQVADTGPGIAADALPHVFDPFFTTRADAERAEQRGSGLGLAVTYGIVQAHGGEITVTSQPGEGATFTVRLPR
jgi:signal transduction histidine kinase